MEEKEMLAEIQKELFLEGRDDFFDGIEESFSLYHVGTRSSDAWVAGFRAAKKESKTVPLVKEKTEAFEEGTKAHDGGLIRLDNPYSSSKPRDEWKLGWEYGQIKHHLNGGV